MRLLRQVAITSFLILLTLTLGQDIRAGGLNIPEGSNGGQICKVTSPVDDVKVVGSLRRALQNGYNIQDSTLPSFCTEAIVFDKAMTITLKSPIQLTNKAASGFRLEKAPEVSGTVILDATGIGDGNCAVVVDSNQVTIRGISIKNASESGICVKSGATQVTIENVVVSNSANGVLVESGATNNVIRNSEFFNNRGFGVRLDTATQNLVDQCSIHNNQVAPVSSTATDLLPIIDSIPPGQTSNQWILNGRVPAGVSYVEIHRGTPGSNNSTYIDDILPQEIIGNTFVKNISAQQGVDIWLIGIGADDSTSPSTEFVKLDAFGGTSGPGTGPFPTPSPGGKLLCDGGLPTRPCVPGQGVNPLGDYDGDGILDSVEDKDGDCQVGPGETDPGDCDTDNDGILDGKEDLNKNGTFEKNLKETDPNNPDTDDDNIPDGIEDLNKDGIRQPNELDPTEKDTDDDCLQDDKEDKNKNGIYDDGPNSTETDGTEEDTDGDNLLDGCDEDKDGSGSFERFRETDPRVRDTDGDGDNDNFDLCPDNPNTSCTWQCIPGQIPDLNVDNDRDTVPDVGEDKNHNCRVDPDETDANDVDTDNDGIEDGVDICPLVSGDQCVCDRDILNEFYDSDGDGIPNGGINGEDKDADCNVDPGESNPFLADTDGDGTLDPNDACPRVPSPLCQTPCVEGAPRPEGQDSDGDGIPDDDEDPNRNCIQDLGVELFNFAHFDTDADGIKDSFDVCPSDPDLNCAGQCVPGEFVPMTWDPDQDGIPTPLEDPDRDCVKDFGETDPFSKESDGDGLEDGREDRNGNGIVDEGETDPANPDTDNDGILDGVEDKNLNGIFGEFDECSPISQDTDNDGLLDFLEDLNKNGVWDAGETNCAQADTDKDGLTDGAEDLNLNGFVDPGETDPRNPDTDGDGATDGQEVNNGTNPIQANESDLNRALGQGCSLGASNPATWNYFGTLALALFGMLGVRIRRSKKRK